MKTKGPQIRSAQVRAIDESERRISAVASTEAVDSYDTILRANWDLDRFARNPVLLWAHNDCQLPIGHCENVRVEGTALLFDAVIDDVTELDRQVWAKFQTGALRGFSVRFNPLETQVITEGGRQITEYLRSELMEISCTPVPANPDALRRSASHRRGTMKKSDVLKALKAASEEGTDEEKAKAAEAYKAMGGDEACKAAEEAEKAEGDDEPKPEPTEEQEEGDEEPKPEPSEDEKDKKGARGAKGKNARAVAADVTLAQRVAKLEAKEKLDEVRSLVDAHADRFTPSTRAWALQQPIAVVQSYVRSAPKLDQKAPTQGQGTRGLDDGSTDTFTPDPKLAAHVDRVLGKIPAPAGNPGFARDANGVHRMTTMTPTQLRSAKAAQRAGATGGKAS